MPTPSSLPLGAQRHDHARPASTAAKLPTPLYTIDAQHGRAWMPSWPGCRTARRRSRRSTPSPRRRRSAARRPCRRGRARRRRRASRPAASGRATAARSSSGTPRARRARCALIGLTKPAAGVIATRPTTIAVARADGGHLPVAHQVEQRPDDQRAHRRQERRRERERRRRACAPSALPALKPNQPNQSRPAPSSVNGTLCGRNAWRA